MKVFLIGMPGAGKTTAGRMLARETGLPFTDLDEWIEATARMSVKEIFEQKGEPAFREMETKALRELIAQPGDRIIACGGGTPCFGDNMARMNAAGLTLYLQASPLCLANRLQDAQDKRPLLRDAAALEDFLDGMLEKRKSFYEQAQVMLKEGFAEEELIRIVRG